LLLNNEDLVSDACLCEEEEKEKEKEEERRRKKGRREIAKEGKASGAQPSKAGEKTLVIKEGLLTPTH